MKKNDNNGKNLVSRRSTLKAIGAVGAAAFLGSSPAYAKGKKTDSSNATYSSSDIRKKISQKVAGTPFIDTHEHLMDERERLAGKAKVDDWSLLFSHYFNSDLISAGMPSDAYKKFISKEVAPLDKWPLVEPYWPAVKNTGYGRNVRISLKMLYDVDELSAKTIKQVQAGYERVRRRGFYKNILCDLANIESCQVNYLGGQTFHESEMPTLLMQDISILGMTTCSDIEGPSKPAGIVVSSLADWHRVIDWWFDKYGKYAVAVKTQHAYMRNIDFEKVTPEQAEPVFKKRLAGQDLSPPERKLMEDHLFWYAVDKATACNLPVKLHTGYYAGENSMGIWHIRDNPLWAAELCRMSPQTKFVFMHISYPYYEEMLAIAKHYTNAYLDMCWAWIINPVASKDFLKKFIVTVPANKVLTFGGDYIPVELVLGHAVIAREGITNALTELVEEKCLTLDDALELTDVIMNGNARKLFNLAEKTRLLKNVNWS